MHLPELRHEGRANIVLPNLQLGSSDNPTENFHGVSIDPLSKILAVKEEGWK